MGLILGGHTVLQHVFGSEASNTKAQELLRQNVREDLAVRWVRGGTDVAAVNFSQLSCDAGEKELLTIGMAADHNSNFDHCLDAKFSVEGMEKDLNFEQDIQPKLKGFSAMNLPTSWHTLVLIVSNRRITEGQAIRAEFCRGTANRSRGGAPAARAVVLFGPTSTQRAAAKKAELVDVSGTLVHVAAKTPRALGIARRGHEPERTGACNAGLQGLRRFSLQSPFKLF